MNFLTEIELQELTDYKRPCDQKRWLKANGYPYEEGGKGKLKVLRCIAESRLGVQDTTHRPQLRQVG